MRKKHREKRTFEGDLIYNRPEYTRFINYLMQRGQKATERKIFIRRWKLLNKRQKKIQWKFLMQP